MDNTEYRSADSKVGAVWIDLKHISFGAVPE